MLSLLFVPPLGGGMEIKMKKNFPIQLGKIYGNQKMSWLRVILFAVGAGIYTGLVMLIPVLNNTSFQDIGISYEWWVIFAVIIVVNCRKSLEAMMKCFVFFLISQPLVFVVEMVAGSLELERAVYYYSEIWLPVTLLTLPGGLIAYYCKKQNVFGAVVLGVGNTIQAVCGLAYFVVAVREFPHHFLSFLVCVGSILVMSFEIQKNRKKRLISLVIPIVLLVMLIGFAAATDRLHV